MLCLCHSVPLPFIEFPARHPDTPLYSLLLTSTLWTLAAVLREGGKGWPGEAKQYLPERPLQVGGREGCETSLPNNYLQNKEAQVFTSEF